MAPPTRERLHRKCCVCVRCSGRLESGVLVVFYLDRPSVVLRVRGLARPAAVVSVSKNHLCLPSVRVCPAEW